MVKIVVASLWSVAAARCFVDGPAQCPTGEECSGNMCCPDGSVCPSAHFRWHKCGSDRQSSCESFMPRTAEFRAAGTCSVGDQVQCPGSTAYCGGNQCCPDLSVCPSADSTFNGCPVSKKEDCTVPSPSPAPTPVPVPPSPPPSGMGFCGVASTVPNKNEATWGPLFKSASINWFWNWDIQATTTDYVPQDWYFVPNLWGSGAYGMNPGVAQHDGPGASTYTVADIMLGWNEPDIVGLCISQPEIMAPADGWCQVAGSMGWWFPDLITNPTSMMSDWYLQHDDSRDKGYRMSSPMVAAFTGDSWLRPFVRASCGTGRCPQLLSWHFYSMGCHDDDSYLDGFIQRMDDTLTLMQEFPSIEGAVITEAGTLALEADGSPPAPTCPDSVLVNVMKKMFEIMRRPKYFVNGRSIVRHFSWFSLDGTGATYSLSLVDNDSGEVRPLGYTYVQECSKMMSLQANASSMMV